jgi:hypothetical protein
MTKATFKPKGKTELRKQATKSLMNQLKPLVKALKENGLEKPSTEDMGVHILFRIIKTYQDYFKLLNTIHSFDAGNGRPIDIQKRGIMLDIYMKLWTDSTEKLPPKQTPFKEAVQAHLLQERIKDASGKFISISEDSCYDFLREMKKFSSSALPMIIKNNLLDV